MSHGFTYQLQESAQNFSSGGQCVHWLKRAMAHSKCAHNYACVGIEHVCVCTHGYKDKVS